MTQDERFKTRESLILLLGRADGQPWATLAEAPSRGEFMYGEHADAILATFDLSLKSEQT